MEDIEDNPSAKKEERTASHARKCSGLTNRGGGGAADVAQGPRVHAGREAKVAHGGGEARLDVEVRAHVLGLLLAPHHLRVAVLRYHLRAHIATSQWPQVHGVHSSPGLVLTVGENIMQVYQG